MKLLLQYKFPLLFFLFVIFYFVTYGSFGYDDADNGYTLALSWRIFNHEVPFRDFIMVRPPLSPIFHALPFYIIPDNYQVIFDRLFTYLLIAFSSLFSAFSIEKTFRVKEYNLYPWLLATIGFVFSVRNFPNMAWHTVDGVFFASVGIYILVCFSSLHSIALGILFLFFSALCKQPFYLLPVAGIGFISVVYKDWKKTMLAVFCLLSFVAIFTMLLYKQNALLDFVKLTSGSTKLKDLIQAGFKNYIFFNYFYLIIPFIAWFFSSRIPYIKYLFGKKYLVPYVFITFLLLWPISKFMYVLLFKEVAYRTFFQDEVAKLFFIVTVFLLLKNLSLEKKWITLWFLILVSWCASISWGYQTPSFFSTPLIFGFFLVSIQYFDIRKANCLALYTLLSGTIVYFVAYQKPYCNPMRYKLNYELSGLFPKLQYIKVGKETFDKYTEFASLVNKYGTNFKTLPGMPLANYITNTNSPIRIDWVFNAETNHEDTAILNDLAQKNTVVFLEKMPQIVKVTNLDAKFSSLVAYVITVNWQKVDSTNYFEVYKPGRK
ncbi:MAG: hypothetical protein ABI763_14900 [Bacteroidota bacterium]